MKEDILESLTFDDVSMLMNEKGSFTEKIISLAENSEYIKFLVDDLIDADSSYFKRLIRLVMSDYRVIVVTSIKNNTISNDSQNIVNLYLEKILTVTSKKVCNLYYKLHHSENEANYFIAILYTCITELLNAYKNAIEKSVLEKNSSYMNELAYVVENIKYELYNGYDAPIHVEDSVRKSYNILEKIMYTMIEDISYDILYLDYIIGGNYV